jgi:hypothetical protein
MDKLLSSFFNELEKIGRATLTWGMEHDPLTVPQGQPGMRPFGGVSRILPSDKPGYYKPPMPNIPEGV